jgi:hypothetical protein
MEVPGSVPPKPGNLILANKNIKNGAYYNAIIIIYTPHNPKFKSNGGP